MRSEPLDLAFRTHDHCFEVGNELLVHRVVCSQKGVKGG